jgi:hypothetical protein
VYVGLPSREDLEFTGGVIQTFPLDQPLNLSVNPGTDHSRFLSDAINGKTSPTRSSQTRIWKKKTVIAYRFQPKPTSNPAEKALPASEHHPNPASPIAAHLFPFSEKLAVYHQAGVLDSQRSMFSVRQAIQCQIHTQKHAARTASRKLLKTGCQYASFMLTHSSPASCHFRK